jgi:hypothetical protein
MDIGPAANPFATVAATSVDAVPLLTWPTPRVLVPTTNITGPVAVFGETVALSVTVASIVTGFGLADAVVVVVAAATVSGVAGDVDTA